MPRLVHRPPAYRRHKSTNQAVVSFLGDRLYLGPYGSPRSLARYQELLKKWERVRHQQAAKVARDDELGPTPNRRTAARLTTAKLREKRHCGVPITISELIFVYRNHTQQYYRKNGELTREAGVIDDALRILRKHHGNTYLSDFGPLLPFIVQFIAPEALENPFRWCILLTGAAFFGVGAAKSRFVEQTWYWAGLETLLVGGAAAALAYMIGILLGGLT